MSIYDAHEFFVLLVSKSATFRKSVDVNSTNPTLKAGRGTRKLQPDSDGLKPSNYCIILLVCCLYVKKISSRGGTTRHTRSNVELQDYRTVAALGRASATTT